MLVPRGPRGATAKPLNSPRAKSSVLYCAAPCSILANTRSPLLHVSPHWLVGGGDDRASGDFDDVSSAPNEFALFIVHHTNIDRQNM